MSYEGYTEYLCQKGHHWQESCYMDSGGEECPRCHDPAVWSHMVDETNGVLYDDDGAPYLSTIPYPLEVDHYEEVIVKRPIYKVPQGYTSP